MSTWRPSPIHLAAETGNLAACTELLSSGADANASREAVRTTSLQLAALWGRTR